MIRPKDSQALPFHLRAVLVRRSCDWDAPRHRLSKDHIAVVIGTCVVGPFQAGTAGPRDIVAAGNLLATIRHTTWMSNDRGFWKSWG